jgi:hypothetical protein
LVIFIVNYDVQVNKCKSKTMAAINSDTKSGVAGGLKLYPSTRSTSTVKSDSVGDVQHEPTKCAVTSRTDVANKLPTSGRLPNIAVPALNKIERGADEEQYQPVKATAPLIGTVVPMTVSSSVKSEKSAGRNYGDTACFEVGALKPGSTTTRGPELFRPSFTGESHTTSFPVALQDLASVLTSSDGELTSATLRDEDVCRLEGEVSTLKEQLEVQLKVVK